MRDVQILGRFDMSQRLSRFTSLRAFACIAVVGNITGISGHIPQSDVPTPKLLTELRAFV